MARGTGNSSPNKQSCATARSAAEALPVSYAELSCAGNPGLEDALLDIGLDPQTTHYRLQRLPIESVTCDFDFSDEDIAWAAGLDASDPVVVYDGLDGRHGMLDGRHRLWQQLDSAATEVDAWVLVERPEFSD
jgi:hypothetical protein